MKMLTESPRASDLTEDDNKTSKASKRSTKKHADENEANEEPLKKGKLLYEREYNEFQEILQNLYGAPEAYSPNEEDKASFFSAMFFNWVRPYIDTAAEEMLSQEKLPTPSSDMGAWNCGRKVSRAFQEAWRRFNAWEKLIGVEVVSTTDANSLGVLRWVGVPQQGGYDDVMAAVEWIRVPAERLAQANDSEHSPFFNGVVHGEKLFEPERQDACTLEEVKSVRLLSVVNDTELIEAIGTPVKPSLSKVMIGALPKYFYGQFPFKAIGDVCTLALPMVLSKFVKYITGKTPTLPIGLLIVFGLFAIQAIQSSSLHRFYHISIKGGLQYRSAIVTVIFEKCFTVSAKSLTKPEINSGRIINMVTTDAERINEFIQYCMYLWSSPTVFLVSIGLLAYFVGWCSLMAIVAMAATLPLNTYIMKVMVRAREQLVKATDVRVKATNEFLSGIRIAKFMTWEPRFIATIEERRSNEIYFLRRVQFCRVWMAFISIATPMVMIGIVFVMYNALGHPLTADVVFPTISLLGVIRMPFMMLPFVFSAAVQYGVSAKRVIKFLECENTAAQSAEDIADLYESGGRGTVCEAAAYLDNVDITAYVPSKLPFAPKIKMTLITRVMRMMCCCGSCSARSQRPTPSAVRREDPEEAGTSPSGSPSTKQPPNASGKPIVAEEAFYEVEPKVLLRDIKVAVPAGKLTVVVGATGSGKSTLLLALLGQLEVSRGHVWATRSIAYVPQQSWIMNATLRDNVLFFSDLDEARLNEALRVSQMETDLELLNNGLDTEIGEKGVNLSGGQKARVNLARAVYADREMYLLDDPLSALDAHVGESVMEDCILGKLRNKTRVLATHQLHVVPKADYIIALDGGKIVFTGESADFLKSDVYEAMALHEHKEKTADENHGTDEDEASVKDAAEKDEGKGKKKAAGDSKLITTEEKATGTVPMSTYFEYFRFCGGLKKAALVGVLFILTEFAVVSSTVWLSIWSSRSSTTSEGSDKKYLMVYIILVLLGTLSSPIRFTLGYNFMRTGSVNLHKSVLESIATGTMEFFDTTPQGRIMNRFSRDIDVADNNLQMSMVSFLTCLMTICSSVLISVSSQPLVILPLLACGYLYYRLMVFYNGANREIRRTSSIAKSPLISLLGEVLSGVSTITAYDKASVIMREALQRLDVVFSCSYLENSANRWLGVRIEMLSNVVVTIIALFGVIFSLTNKFKQNTSLVSLSLTMALQTTAQLNWLVRQAATVEADMNSVERLIFYTKNVQHEDMPELGKEVEDIARRAGLDGSAGGGTAEAVTIVPPSESKAPTAVQAGSLEFRGVQMRYREGLPLVLSDVSFRIEPREKVGIVGRTGSGKSTLLLTFMRMVDVCGGTIEVNGRAIRSYPLRELRRQFSMIPQDPVLFDGTVRLNVDPFLQASAAEVWSALEIVGLKERVSSEPEGIDGRVLEGGSNFSVGQRQLLCMARALLKKGSGFILMDEATANIDQSLDRQIQGTVMRAFADYTVITIAHRLLTVAQYDKIIVMDHGVVAEMGSPRELVTREDSVFRGMVKALGKKEMEKFMNSMNSVKQ